MNDPREEQDHNPMNHPEEQPGGSDDVPHFGRLLFVLLLAVVLVGIITFASEAWYSK